MGVSKRYSAGAIFLQVVPVFANVQRAIQDEVKDIDRALGDEMERAGDRAGRRAGQSAAKSMREELGKTDIGKELERQVRDGVDGIDKALAGINTKNLGKKLRGEIREMRSDLDSLRGVDLTIDDNLDKVGAKVEALKGQIEDMRKRSKVFFDIEGLPQVYRKLAEVKKTISDIDGNIKLDVDTRGAERKLGSFERQIKSAMAKASQSIGDGPNKDLRRLRDELEYLGRLRVGVDIGSNQLRREVSEITAELKKLAKEDPEIDVKFDAGRAYAQLASFTALANRVDGRTLNVDVDVDTANGSRNLSRITKDGESAANSFRSFNAVLFAAAGAGPAVVPVLAAIAGGLLAIGPAAAVAGAGLGSVLVGFSGIGDAVGALGDVKSSAPKDAMGAAKTMTSAANSIADAERAVAEARRSGAERIEDAERTLARARKDAAESIRDAERSLTRVREDNADRLVDAERALADARNNAVRDIARAEDAQREAEDRLLRTQKNVTRAQEDLNEARRQAVEDIEDLSRSIRGAQLSEDQAVIDLFNATNDYNRIQADGAATTTEKEQARINLELARLKLEEIRDTQANLADEKAKADAAGVEGSDKVKDAQDRLNDALEAEKAAHEDSAKAAEELRDTQLEAARDIADAEKDLADVRTDNAERLADAERSLNRARQDGVESISDAERSLARARADAARSVADARRNLAQAEQGYQDALQQTGEIGSASMQKLNDAMSKLGPAGQEFARFLFGLQQQFYSFREDVQAVLLPAVQEAMQSFLGSESASTLRDTLIQLAAGFGQFAKALSVSLQGEAWTEFFTMLADLGPDIMAAYGSAFISFLEAMASILTTLAPYALDFAQGVAFIADAFADWAASASGQKQIQDFMSYVESVAPKVIAFVVALADAAVQVAKGLADWGEVVLGGITGFLNMLANMDPQALSGLVTGVLILITASQSAYAVLNVLLAGATLLASTIGVAIFAIVGIGLALAYVYKTNEKFRDLIREAWPKIKKSIIDVWETVKPAIKEFGDALGNLLVTIGPAIVWFATEVLPLVSKYFALQVKAVAWLITNIWIPLINIMVDVVKWTWEHILRPTWKAIEAAATWLWKNILKPAFAGIQADWSAMVAVIKFVWNQVLSPIWDAIKAVGRTLWNREDGGVLGKVFSGIGKAWDTMGGVFSTVWGTIKDIWDTITKKDGALDHLRDGFRTAIDAIATLWEGLKKIVGAPIKFVLDTIINEGLIDGFNKVAGWVGKDGFDHIPIPKALQSYATGGVMPGYTPGRDVHRFVSPTAGMLELSGGEAVMRPEFTAAIGADTVNHMNAIARSGGVNALRRALYGQAFAKGGIFWPLPGSHAGTYDGHDGVDLNVGSGWDDDGMPFYSATSGRVTTTGYGRGYGNAIFIASPYGELVYGHSQDGSIAVRMGQSVLPGTFLARVGNTGNSSAPHLHFGFPGGSYGAAMALLSGAPVGTPGDPGSKGGFMPSIPGWVKGLLKNPVDTVKGWATDQWGKASEFVTDSPVWGIVKHVPEKLVGGIKDKVMGIVPDWAKGAAGIIGDIAGGVKDGVGDVVGGVGDALGLHTGGILPYNGTMMYDNGGYLPPGLTNVVNLTGKPEPVFTEGQFKDLGDESRTDVGDRWDLTFNEVAAQPEDIADTLMFRVRTKERRGSRYGGS